MGWGPADLTGFVRLPREQRTAILRAVTMVPKVSRSLRRVGYHQTRARLAARQSPPLQVAGSMETAKRADAAIRRLPWKVRCLDRSLVVWWVVGGAPAEIRLGVGPSADGVDPRFHAWVELGGVVVNDRADIAGEFSPLSSSRAESMRPADFD